MAEASIPVNIYNPGQVLACLGFMEAANELCGDAWGRFDWHKGAKVNFHLKSSGTENPFAVALNFFVNAEIQEIDPVGTNSDGKRIYPDAMPKSDKAYPIKLIDQTGNICVTLTHWADGSGRNKFKLYAGNRSAFKIAKQIQEKLIQLWNENQNSLIETPFDILTPMGGSFNFDPRGAWTSIDIGFSLNKHSTYYVESSPVVEIFSAWGLENSRLDEYQNRRVRYTTWGVDLPINLARAAITNHISKHVDTQHQKQFQFEMLLSGKNKIFTLAKLEAQL